MAKVTFIQPDGRTCTIDAVVGDTLAMNALGNLVPGIVGECGGGLSCATCHVFIDESWTDAVGGPSKDESGMLDTTAVVASDKSRLSCQIIVTEDLAGLVVHIPERQE
jgi:2Fe-2S ferredoxin